MDTQKTDGVLLTCPNCRLALIPGEEEDEIQMMRRRAAEMEVQAARLRELHIDAIRSGLMRSIFQEVNGGNITAAETRQFLQIVIGMLQTGERTGDGLGLESSVVDSINGDNEISE